MNHRILIGCLFLPPLVVSGCFQELDTGAALGGPTGGTSGGAPASTTCAPDSPQCFAMCSAPSCYLAVPDGSIPAASETPPIYDLLGEGGSTLDPCAQMESESKAIRTRSCAQCHTALKQGGFDYVLDDGKLTTQSSSTTNPATGQLWRMIVPGDPASSFVYARIVGGTMPPVSSTIAVILGTKVGATVMRPTVADQSVLYTWILNCVPGADGGAYSVTNYGAGPGYGPAMGGGSEGGDGGGSAPSSNGGDGGSD